MNRQEFRASFDALPEWARQSLTGLSSEVEALTLQLAAARRALAELSETAPIDPEPTDPEPSPPIERRTPPPDPFYGYPTRPMSTAEIRRLGLSDG